MHNKIDEIKKNESSPKIIKNLFTKDEINKFISLYEKLPTTVHNKKQNVIKKRWLKEYGKEMEELFYGKLKNEIGEFPTIDEGVRGMEFIEKAVESNKNGNIWMELDS